MPRDMTSHLMILLNLMAVRDTSVKTIAGIAKIRITGISGRSGKREGHTSANNRDRARATIVDTVIASSTLRPMGCFSFASKLNILRRLRFNPITPIAVNISTIAAT